MHPYTVSSLVGDLIRADNVTVGEGGAGELLPHARLHDLRHVHATTLLLAGGPYRAIPGIWAQLDRICFKDVGLISTPSPCDLHRLHLIITSLFHQVSKG
jgi:hypothetical protein